MTRPAEDPPAGQRLRHRSPPLHPLEVRPAPRRRLQFTLILQLLHTAGCLAASTSLVLPTTGLALASGGALTAVAARAAANRCRRRAWSGLPRPVRLAAMPLTDERRYTAASALLLTIWAAAVSLCGTTGGVLAALIGVHAAADATRSVVLLAGRAPAPTRRVPALTAAAVTSWCAAATAGGLGAAGVLRVIVAAGSLVGAGYILLAVTRHLVRATRP